MTIVVVVVVVVFVIVVGVVVVVDDGALRCCLVPAVLIGPRVDVCTMGFLLLFLLGAVIAVRSWVFGHTHFSYLSCACHVPACAM